MHADETQRLLGDVNVGVQDGGDDGACAAAVAAVDGGAERQRLETVDSATNADAAAAVPHGDAARAPVVPNDALRLVPVACAVVLATESHPHSLAVTAIGVNCSCCYC